MGHTAATVQAWLGYLRLPEFDALRRLAAGLPDGAVVVNLGAGAGTSGLVFMESPNHLRVFTVDKQKESHPTGCLSGEEVVFRSAGFWGDPRHKQIHSDSTDAGIMWDGPKIDLLFHDADHERDKVTMDLEAWRPHMKPGGLIVLHDYREDRGVKPAADHTLADCERLSRVENMATFRLPGGRSSSGRSLLPDIVTTGWPCSGNTWTLRLLSHLLLAPIGTLTDEDLDTRWFDGMPGPWVLIKSHVFLPSLSGYERIIGIVRDPRDVAICRWMRRRHDQPFTLLERIRRFGESRLASEEDGDGYPYLDFVEALFESGRPLVRYEDLHTDGPETIARVASQVTGQHFSAEQARLSFKAVTFERCKEADPHFTRKGISGDWRNHFEQEHGKLANELWGDHLIRRGYETDPKWWEGLPSES